MSTTELKLNGLGGYLVTHGYINKSTALHALKESNQQKISFILYLGQHNYLNDCQLAQAVANYFGLPFFDLNGYDLKMLPQNLLHTDLIQRYSALPLFRKENQLLLAVFDPSLPDVNEINFLTRLNTVLIIVEINKLLKLIDTIYSTLQTGFQNEDIELDITLDLASEEKIKVDLPVIESDRSPVVRFLNKTLLDAINKGASDIHFEPCANYYRIRFRMDGILYEINRQPIQLINYLTARLKVMANLDISERRVPQDGHFKIKLSPHRAIDFRLNTCPTLFGEKAVLRILKSSKELLNLNRLGMDEHQKKDFHKAIFHPQGMILVTGPTGSGKTVTLYTALDKLNTSAVNISSIEDPIEIHLNGINQIQINLKAGLTFANTLRALLRQDPDIIMIGEIRDLETAQIAVKAAQTGHLVLSTVHTNSAPETLIRLANLGIAPFNIASSIILIIAQRLVRRLCHHCKEKIIIPENVLLQEGFNRTELPELTLYKAQGCPHCQSGYHGRIGIYELLPISKEIVELIMKNAGSLELADQARRENLPNLRRSGLDKVKEGITSLEELNRVIRE